MRRSATIVTGLLLLVSLTWLAGCDAFESSPSGVEDFDIQGNINTPTGRTVTPDLRPKFSVDYQGLSAPPTASAPAEILAIDTVSTEGEPERGGARTWRVRLTTEEIDEVLIQEPVVVRGNTASGASITDTLLVSATTTLSIERDFSTSFATIADFEGDVDDSSYGDNEVETEPYGGSQRTVNTSGGTATSIVSGSSNQPGGSNGTSFLEVEGSSSGSVTIDRWASVPDSDAFYFLLRPASSSFNLTVTLTEEKGAGTQSYELELPVPAGGGWFRVGVPSRFFEGFNPVASRAGGDGPFTSVDFSADSDVTYAVDQIVFGQEGGHAQVEVHDFERTSLAYGPPFGSNNFGFAMGADSIDAESDGLTSRRISGQSFFGYNYTLFVEVDGNDVLTFRAKGSTETPGQDQIETFLEANGQGGFGTGNIVTVTAPEGSWETFEIPISDLGNDPSVLQDPGISNVGFNARGTFLIDDIKIKSRQ